MADFEKMNQFSEPQGAGAQPIAPVAAPTPVNATGMFLEAAGGPTLGLIDALWGKLKDNSKVDFKNNILQNMGSELEVINTGFVTGQYDAAQTKTRMSAVYSKYAAGYAQYGDDITKYYKNFTGSSESSDAFDAEKYRVEQLRADEKYGKDNGIDFYKGMSKEAYDKSITLVHKMKANDAEFERLQKRAAYVNMQNAEERAKYKFDVERAAERQMAETVPMLFDQGIAYVVDLTKLNPKEAEAKWMAYNVKLEEKLASAAALYPGAREAYNRPLNAFRELGNDLLSGKLSGAAAENARKMFQDNAILIAYKRTPDAIRAYVDNQLYPGAISGRPDQAVGRQSTMALLGSLPYLTALREGIKSDLVPSFVGSDPELEKGTISDIKLNISKFARGEVDPNRKNHKEQLYNVINNYATMVKDASSKTGGDVLKLKEGMDFFGSPEFRIAVDKGLVSNETLKAISDLNSDKYSPEIIRLIDTKLNSTARLFGENTFGSLVTFEFSGGRINLVPSPGKFSGAEVRNRETLIKEMKSTVEQLNNIVNVGAVVAGQSSADYWESSKHYLVPSQFQMGSDGQVVNISPVAKEINVPKGAISGTFGNFSPNKDGSYREFFQNRAR